MCLCFFGSDSHLSFFLVSKNKKCAWGQIILLMRSYAKDTEMKLSRLFLLLFMYDFCLPGMKREMRENPLHPSLIAINVELDSMCLSSVVIPGGKTIFVSFPYHHYYHVWLSFWFSLLISLTFCILQRNEKIERETLQAASNFSVCSSLLEKKRMKCSLLLFYARNIVTSDEGSILRETVRKGSPREEWKRARRIMAWRGFKERKRQTQTDNERKRETKKQRMRRRVNSLF